jgi:hypothetical protein
MVRRDALWVRGALDESRVSQGQAVGRGREIVARDRIDNRDLAGRLRAACDREMERLQQAVAPLKDARIRGMVTATESEVEATVTITVDGVSVVASPDDVASTYTALRRLLRPPAAHPPPRPMPIVWRNGSAAVLLHEAIGHAAEHAHARLDWPRWLRARDIARDGRAANLIDGEIPAAMRRESFHRYSAAPNDRSHFEQVGAPFELPSDRIRCFSSAAEP